VDFTKKTHFSDIESSWAKADNGENIGLPGQHAQQGVGQWFR